LTVVVPPAGTPCSNGRPAQGFSTSGSRNQEDERNQLLGVFVDIVIALRPWTFCIENVPGLLEPPFATAPGKDVDPYEQRLR
jgi:site-specific DNA-cytosine methylase